jgi:hypothetical protein
MMPRTAKRAAAAATAAETVISATLTTRRGQ